MALVGCMDTGCGNSGDGDAVKHPKYPDLFATLTGADGQSGFLFWRKLDDGYEQYPSTRRETTNDGTPVVCKPVYNGTKDAGDVYVIEVSVGEAKETKEVVYEGKRVEVNLADGVKFILKPSPM